MNNSRIVIEPGSDNKHYWKDLWKFRQLFYFLAWRDILVRYKQTFIGVIWSILRPLLTIVAMVFIGWIFNSPVPSGLPRVLVVSIAVLPWQFFFFFFSETSNSLIANSNLLTKVYFPRFIVPVSTIIVCLIDFLISFVIILIIGIYYKFSPDLKLLLLPFFLLHALIAALGTGLFIAALNVKYRDFRYIIPFIIQFGLYASPVAFSSSDIYLSQKIPSSVKFIYSLNPMVGVIDGFKWCMLGGHSAIYLFPYALSVTITLLFLLLGVYYFRRMEKSFADII